MKIYACALIKICVMVMSCKLDAMHMIATDVPEQPIIDITERVIFERAKSLFEKGEYKEAKFYFEELIESNNCSLAGLSCLYLAQMYHFGWGVTTNFDKAFELCEAVDEWVREEERKLETKEAKEAESDPVNGDLLAILFRRRHPLKPYDTKRLAEIRSMAQVLQDKTFDPSKKFSFWDAETDTKIEELPLLFAVRKGYNLFLTLLINFGVRLELRDGERSVVSLAFSTANEEGAALLLAHQSPWNAFHVKVFQKESALVAALLKGGQPVDERDTYGITPLHIASFVGDVRIIQILLDNGADIDARDNDGKTALHWAAQGSSTSNALSVLLKRGANVLALTKNGMKPFHLACQFNSIEAVEVLVKTGPLITLEELDSEHCGGTMLFGVNQKRKRELAAVVYAHLSPDDFLEFFKVLLKSAEAGIVYFIEALPKNSPLLSFADDHGDTLLHAASRNNKIEAARLLLKKGANPNALNKANRTPFHEAHDDALVKKLIEGGGDCRVVDRDGLSLLHTSERSRTQVALLVDHGADIHAVTNKGETPLCMFLGSDDMHYAVLKLLLERGASPFVQVEGSSVLHKVENSLSAQLLIEKGVPKDALDADGYTPLQRAIERSNLSVVEVLLAAGADPNKFSEGTVPPLFMTVAPRAWMILILKALLEHGARVTLTYKGNFALHDATARAIGDTKCIEELKLLIAHGADINALNNEGRTPFHMAAAKQHHQVTSYLLGLNIDQTIKDKDGKSARDLASEDWWKIVAIHTRINGNNLGK